jgi:protein-tyrosine phosphatase
MDFNFVSTRVATGAALLTVDDAGVLEAAGITHVIDCRAEFDDAPYFIQQSMQYLWNGVDDDGQPKPGEWFAKSITFALPALALPGTKVYAHCAAGVNRGPSTAYAILRALGYSAVLAEAEIRTARPQVNIAYMRDADSAIAQMKWV